MTAGVVLSPLYEDARDAPVTGAFGDHLEVGSLQGKRVGIRGDVLWRSWAWVSEEWVPPLVERGAVITTWKSGTRGGDEAERSEKGLQEFLEGLELAVVGLGTCGSCTMWTMHDALAAADRGIPTVAVVTSHFAKLARVFAETGGWPDLPIYVLPYPLETRPESEVRDIARDNLRPLLEQLGVGT